MNKLAVEKMVDAVLRQCYGKKFDAGIKIVERMGKRVQDLEWNLECLQKDRRDLVRK